MTIANLYRKLKQILNDSNTALTNKGFETVSNLYEIPNEIAKYNINKLPYLLGKEIIQVTADDLSGVTVISNAFSYCISLTDITIPDGVTSIGSGAFSNCTSLTDIYLYPTTPPSLDDIGAIPDTTTVHVPIGSGDVYKNETNWSYHSDRIVEDIVIE